MSTSPMMFNPAQTASPYGGLRSEWLLAFSALVFVACTSTSFMGCQTSQVVVDAVWKALFGTWHWDKTGAVNGFFRKTGHFFGYGLISLLFRNAWYKTAQTLGWIVRKWLTPFAGALAIVTAFAVSGMDELHQHFVPGRIGSLRDALIDTAGALFVNLAFWSIQARKHGRALY
jgi:VanZ family protein